MNEPKRVTSTLIEVGIVAVVLTVMAMMIVPAFMKKVKERKAMEASENVRLLFNASVEYFKEQVESGEMDPDNATFPPSTEAHPRTVGRDAQRTSDWHTIPAFEALGFSLTEPHYFQYAYESSGTGLDAHFTVSAFGDLDGDGVLSRYQIEGFVDQWEVRGENIVVDRFE